MAQLLIAASLLSSCAYAADFDTPQAGSFYPIYNSGVNQYIQPTTDMPFDKISTLYVAFAHSYPDGENGAKLDFESGQPDEPQRLANLIEVAKKVNPKIKILISLGWGHNDWEYIGNDYTSGKNAFANSVVAFIRNNHLDGFDIDDESVSGISQQDFDGVVKNIRTALDNASVADNKQYYLTVTPAFGTANVDQYNKDYFDMVNVQNYGGSSAEDFINIGVPKNKIAVGINSEGCHPNFPDNSGLAGIFNWTMSADSVCNNFEYTKEIASKVNYQTQ